MCSAVVAEHCQCCPRDGMEKSRAQRLDVGFRALFSFLSVKFTRFDTKQVIRSTIVECAALLPTKTMVYGVLVGLLNRDNIEFVDEIVEDLSKALHQAIVHLNFRRVRLLLRFIGVLVQV